MNSDDAFKLYKSEDFPKFLQFETNTRCNAKCHMCPHCTMEKRPEMSWSSLNTLIETLIPKVESTCPFLMQEPSNEPRLRGILNYIKQINHKCATTVYSNMMGWTPEQIKWMVEDQSLDVLAVSYYAPTEELHRKWQPGRKNGYDWAMANIKSARMYRDELKLPKPFIEGHFLAVKELLKGLESGEYSKRVGPYLDSFGIVPFDTFHGAVPDYGCNAELFGPPSERTPCPRLWSGFNVHSNGNVVPCCIDYAEEYVVGNIFEEKPEDIWRGEKLNALRRLHVEGRINESELCRNCIVYQHQHPAEWNNLWLKK